MGSIYLYTELVEKGRSKLYDAASRYGMSADETIHASQVLDEILNLRKHLEFEEETECNFED